MEHSRIQWRPALLLWRGSGRSRVSPPAATSFPQATALARRVAERGPAGFMRHSRLRKEGIVPSPPAR